MKVVKEVKVKEELIDYIQRLFYEYVTRKDVISTLFEQHKFDDNAAVLDSVPFKHYEELFQKSKVEYDTAMEEVNNTIVPEEYRKDGYRFEIDFENKVVRVMCNG